MIPGEVVSWFHHEFHHEKTEKTMSVATDFQALAAHVTPIIQKAEVVLANPETSAVLDDLATLAGLPVPAGLVTRMAESLKALKDLYTPPAPDTAAPAA